MQEFDIKGRTTVTATVKAQIDESPLALPAPPGMDGESMQSFMDAANSSADSLKENSALLKEFGNIMPEIVKNLRYMNQIVANTNRNLPSVGKKLTDEEQRKKGLAGFFQKEATQFINTGSGMFQSMTNGNLAGVVMGGVNGIGGMVNTAASAASLAPALKALAPMLGPALIGIAGATAVLAGGNALADKYIESMPTLFGSGKSFGAKSDAQALSVYDRVNAFNSGTGLDTDAFHVLAQSLRKQGLGNGLGFDSQINYVSDIARTTSRWAYATNGDANRYAELAGLMGRYGGSKDVSSDFNYLVSAGKASGMNDTQIPEFLDGIKKVMEEGVARGFETSATEVADTLLMFSKLSGGDKFWQGEQGAKMLSKANAGIAGATALSKTEDILVYAAMEKAYNDKAKRDALKGSYVEGAQYANTMQMIERGIRGDNYNAIMGYITSSYGSKDEQIEALRNMTGLNYNGAARLLNLGNGATDTQIKEIFAAPENQTKENRYQESVNKIKETVVKFGDGPAGVKIAGMEGLSSTVKRLADFIIGDKGAKEEASSIQKGFTGRQKYLAHKNEGSVYRGDDVQKRDNSAYLSTLDYFDRVPADWDPVFDNYNTKVVGGTMPYWQLSKDFTLRNGQKNNNNIQDIKNLYLSGFNSRMKQFGTENEVDEFFNEIGRKPEWLNQIKTTIGDAVKPGSSEGTSVSISEQEKIFNLLEKFFEEYKKPHVLYESR